MTTTVSNVVTLYETNTITVTLSTGEIITISMSSNVGTPSDEVTSKQEVRVNRIFDALRQAQLRVINSLGDIATLP